MINLFDEPGKAPPEFLLQFVREEDRESFTQQWKNFSSCSEHVRKRAEQKVYSNIRVTEKEIETLKDYATTRAYKDGFREGVIWVLRMLP